MNKKVKYSAVVVAALLSAGMLNSNKVLATTTDNAGNKPAVVEPQKKVSEKTSASDPAPAASTPAAKKDGNEPSPAEANGQIPASTPAPATSSDSTKAGEKADPTANKDGNGLPAAKTDDDKDKIDADNYQFKWAKKPDKAIKVTAEVKITDSNGKEIKPDERGNIKIRYREDLSLKDVYEYYKMHLTVYHNGSPISNTNNNVFYPINTNEDRSVTPSFSLYDANNNYRLRQVNFQKGFPNVLLNVGDRGWVGYSTDNGGTSKNTWYEWEQPMSLDGDFRRLLNRDGYDTEAIDQLTQNFYEEQLKNRHYLIFGKTDEKGSLPQITYIADDGSRMGDDLGVRDIASANFKVVPEDSKDADVLDIPHILDEDGFHVETPHNIIYPNNSVTNNVSAKPSKKQQLKNDEDNNYNNVTYEDALLDADRQLEAHYEAKDEERAQEIQEEHNEEEKEVANNKDALETSTDTQDNDQKIDKPLMVSRNSFVYDKNDKLVKNKYGMIKTISKFKNVVALDHGKAVTINGKKYYRIGKNQYIKISNTSARPKATSISASGKIKGKRVTLYTADGKALRKINLKGKTLKFDQKKFINGRKYYRATIDGKKVWIRAIKVSLKK